MCVENHTHPYTKHKNQILDKRFIQYMLSQFSQRQSGNGLWVDQSMLEQDFLSLLLTFERCVRICNV